MRTTLTRFNLGLMAVFMGSARSEAITYFFAMPYRSEADSPFAQGIQNGTIYLETFEDGRLDTPYVTGWNGGIYDESDHHSVDADDGVLDGKHGGGYNWTRHTSNGSSGTKPPGGMHFDFSPNMEGKLPEYAGGVLFGAISGPLEGAIFYHNLLVFDAAGNEVTGGWRVPIPETTILGTTIFSPEYDRFVGIHVPGGISRIVFSNVGWLDHLQYGYAIPEPGASTLALLVGAGLLNRRRR